MPKALHAALERAADKKGLKGKQRRRYIYGGMRRAGWKPEREKKADATFEYKIALLKHAIEEILPSIPQSNLPEQVGKITKQQVMSRLQSMPKPKSPPSRIKK